MNRSSVLVGCLVVTLVALGCSHSHERTQSWGADGTMVGDERRVDNGVVYELNRVLERNTVQGTGEYKAPNKLMAQKMARTLAEADVISQLGQTIQSADTTLISDDAKNRAMSVLRSSSDNIIQGYRPIAESYDEETQTATSVIELTNHRVIKQFERELHP